MLSVNAQTGECVESVYCTPSNCAAYPAAAAFCPCSCTNECQESASCTEATCAEHPTQAHWFCPCTCPEARPSSNSGGNSAVATGSRGSNSNIVDFGQYNGGGYPGGYIADGNVPPGYGLPAGFNPMRFGLDAGSTMKDCMDDSVCARGVRTWDRQHGGTGSSTSFGGYSNQVQMKLRYAHPYVLRPNYYNVAYPYYQG